VSKFSPYDLLFSHNTSVTDDERRTDRWQSCHRRLQHSCSASKRQIKTTKTNKNCN